MTKRRILNTKKIQQWYKYNPETGAVTASSNHPTVNRLKGRRLGCIHKTEKYRIMSIGVGQYFPCGRIIWVLMTGNDPLDKDVDHINGLRNDDRWVNLRLVTPQQNHFNRGPNKNTRLPKGISYYGYKKLAKAYRAQIVANGKNIYLGYFKTLDEAIKVRSEAEIKYFGQYRRQDHSPTSSRSI